MKNKLENIIMLISFVIVLISSYLPLELLGFTFGFLGILFSKNIANYLNKYINYSHSEINSK